jgi:hypothetical protein
MDVHLPRGTEEDCRESQSHVHLSVTFGDTCVI